MIIKSYEIKKINLENDHFILFYGKNEGYKNETINNLTKYKNKNEIIIYEEKYILENTQHFLDSVLTKSLFEKEKIIIIKRATDKIIQIISEIYSKNLDGILIIINSENLEKKSKLRSFFEKEKKCICVAFYPDTEQTISKLAYNFLREKKISISQANINLLSNRCNGDRQTLLAELKKVEYFCKNGKKITAEILVKLSNLAENYSISELVDNCLAKNKKAIINILNENNFSNDDCIVIVRTFINKSKRILKLSNDFENNKNMNLTISSAKPPIFWKDKEIIKQQIHKWSPENIKKLIYKLRDIELQIKQNIHNSINLIIDFILEQTSTNTNN